MGPSPTYHPPEGEECETSMEHGLPLWAEPAVGYCSRRPRRSPMWGSRFVGAPEVGPWSGEQKPLGKQLQSREDLPTYLKLEKCEFMQETMQYLGFDIGYGWWTPAAFRAQPLMDAKV